MILLAASESVRKAFHIQAIETTPPVPSDEWYRFWRVDARKLRGLGEVMLFTNYETLYTFVADSRPFRGAQDVAQRFLQSYQELFDGHFGYEGAISEKVIAHRAVDRSVQGVMNSFFRILEGIGTRKAFAELEVGINNM